jgi:hypothetical protein
VQEEALDLGKEFKRYEPFSHKHVHKSAYPLPLPPKLDKPSAQSGADDRRATEAVRANSSSDKLRALHQEHRARGLCDRCVEKWSYDHKCASTVQLHAIQELWQLFPDSGIDIVDVGCFETEEPHLLCVCLSEAALKGVASSMSEVLGVNSGQNYVGFA